MEHLLHIYYCKEEAFRRWISEITESKEILTAGVDLFEKLKNGFILCRLIRHFNARIIPKLNEDPNLPAFQLRRNISFFIEACIEFGVPRLLTFTESDLQEITNPPKLLLCLELLAEKLVQSKGEEWKGPVFSEIFGSLSISTIKFTYFKRNELKLLEQIREINQIYFKLNNIYHYNMLPNASNNNNNAALSINSLTSWNRTFHQNSEHHHLNANNANNNNNNRKRDTLINSSAHRKKKVELEMEEIERTMNLTPIAQQFTPQITLLQSSLRSYFARRAYFQTLKNETYRENVANEILLTERLYVENLRVLIDVFLNPLKAKQSVLVVDHIYSEAQIILAFSSLLFKELEPRIENWNPSQKIGDIFLGISDYMKVYTQYIKDYSLFIELLGRASKDPTFKAIVTELQADDRTKKLSFESFLILPIQRIPRYEMLLRDLLRHTSDKHTDFQNLNQALSKIQNVASYVNEKKREFDNLHRVIELQKSFKSKESYAEPHRKLIAEFAVEKVPSSHEFCLFLFNDILLVARASKLYNISLSKAKYKIKACIDFQDLIFESSDQNLIMKIKDEKYSITFNVATVEDRRSLLSHIKAIQEKLKESRSSRGINIWKKNNNSELYLQMENEYKELRKSSTDSSDPRSRFMRKVSNKLHSGMDPRNILEIVKNEEEKVDAKSRVLAATLPVPDKPKKLKKPKKEKKITEGLKKNLAPPDRQLRRARSRSLI